MRIEISHPSAGRVIFDIIMVVLLVWTAMCLVNNNIINGRTGTWGILYNDYVSKVALMAVVYSVSRLCFTIHFQCSRIILYVVLCAVSLREMSFCILQLLHGNGALTGTMGNSGLLGGLISVCLCVFGAEIVKSGRYIRLLFLLPLIALEIASFSRASWLSCLTVTCILCLKNKRLNHWISKWRNLLFPSVFIVGIVIYYLKKESADSRMFMNLMILRNCYKVGLFGVGPGNYCGFYGRSLFDYFLSKGCGHNDSSIECVEVLTRERIVAGLPDCSYNELLMAFVETGFVGALLLTAVSLLAFLRLYRNNDPMSYGFLALLIFSQFSFPSMEPLFCGLFAILLASGASTFDIKRQNEIRWYHMVCPLLCFLVFVSLSKTRKVDSLYKELIEMQDLFDLGLYDDAAKTGALIYGQGYASPKFLLMYGMALRNINEYDKSDKVIHHGLEMSVSPEFWKVLGDNSVSKGDYLMAEKHYLHSFIMMPNRLQPLLDLAILYNLIGETKNLSRIGTCTQRMIPKIENEKTKCIKEEIMALQKAER